ncbi:cupin domain-containing protein [Pseudalkalibacillus caeni]|uniref:Acireductone dioxygenase n=1 Tax=Exobacillus caeni TaxID=2574798 RepID=A0A5R9F3Y4_9BACL|nr:cupin domain-containing protein [Pseudalkalibacillus caeni]TLS38307.1 cupin domain-containing protein [Pseudalkalibacillus caeni]
MAVIKIRNTNERIEGTENVKQFLENEGVLYERWDTSKLPEELKGNCQINDEQKEEVLQVFDEEIRSLAERNGYVKWDVVALSEATPDLESLLKKFEQVHVHTEDEVRAITAGHGIFIIKGQGDTGYFDVELEPGDVISVPVETPHFFTLMDDRQVVAVRLFIDPSGWVAHPFKDPEFEEQKA